MTHHKKVLGMLMNNAELVHRYASSAYGKDKVLTLMEWPRGCHLWQHEAVNHFRTMLGLSHEQPVDGCSLGWKSIDPKSAGMPLKKPLLIASSHLEALLGFAGCQCAGCKHAPTAGKNIKHSEHYTPPFCHIVHESFVAFEQRINNAGSEGWTEVGRYGSAAPTRETVPDTKPIEEILMDAIA